MGFFDRIGNLGKGLVKVWSDPETRKRERDRRLKALEEELERLLGTGRTAAAPAARRSYLDRLEQAFRDGILTEDEYARKRVEALESGGPVSADAPASADPDEAPPEPPGPVKRTL